ncbi:MAG TPA: alkaline phosphatase [Candidatus Eisenbacteria bacterium]|nr:alkaline phosphatase [Candidatus Eisenbacteria bacterium]
MSQAEGKMRNRAMPYYTALFAVALFAWLAHWVAVSTGATANRAASGGGPKYIFLFLADGGGIPHLEITRQYNRLLHDEGMVIVDHLLREGMMGVMTTHAGDSLSTDSAAAATALAVGCKANNGALGVCADGTVTKTVMELAKEGGMRIGLVTNAPVYDASPAAFVCHVPNRRDYGAIVDRYLELEPDVIFGGGKDQFLPRGRPGSARQDDRDLIEAFAKKGYRYASDKQTLQDSRSGRVLGLFGLKEMNFEIDRDKSTEPSLSEMTRAAIRILHERNERGFLLFVENENIDTAGHLTDIAALIHDYREFDRAVGMAYEFYKKYPRETLILVTSDHETGGLGFTMALKDLSSTRGSNRVAGTIEDLKKIASVPMSLSKAAETLGPRPTAKEIDRLMQEHFKGFTLAPEYREAILEQRPISRTIFGNPTVHALGMMIANQTQAYWLTSGHTNHPVLVAALGPGAETFRGYYDNTDFGKRLKGIVAGREPR